MLQNNSRVRRKGIEPVSYVLRNFVDNTERPLRYHRCGSIVVFQYYQQKEEGVPLNINGDPADGEPCMFVKGMYFSVFYCLCYDTNIYTDISEDQVA